MEEQGETQVVKRTQRDYSLAFKLMVVEEVERGDLTYIQSQKKYGIQGRSTVLKWLRKHGRLNWINKDIMKQRQTPHQKLRELEKKVKRLEAEKEILNRAIDIADDMLGADIRKKYLPLLLEASGQQGENKQDNQQGKQQNE
jgi:transposase-like protein